MAPDESQEPGSVSRLFPGLAKGDHAAITAIWRCFYGDLVKLAARRLDAALRAVEGPEDVAQEALLELCRELAEPEGAERFPRLASRRDLWKLLVCFTVRRVCRVRRKQFRRTDVVAGESALGEAGLDGQPGRELPAPFAAAASELLATLPEELRRVAQLRLEGWSNQDIAARIDRSVKVVEVRLKSVRAHLKPRIDHAP